MPQVALQFHGLFQEGQVREVFGAADRFVAIRARTQVIDKHPVLSSAGMRIDP